MRDLIDPAKGCRGIYLTSLRSCYVPAVRCHLKEILRGRCLRWNTCYQSFRDRSHWQKGVKTLPVQEIYVLAMTKSTTSLLGLQLQTLNKSAVIYIFEILLTVFCCPSPGAIHLQFHSSGNHYVWRKVTSTVHNIIVGKLWIDQVSLQACLIGNHSSRSPEEGNQSKALAHK